MIQATGHDYNNSTNRIYIGQVLISAGRMRLKKLIESIPKFKT